MDFNTKLNHIIWIIDQGKTKFFESFDLAEVNRKSAKLRSNGVNYMVESGIEKEEDFQMSF